MTKAKGPELRYRRLPPEPGPPFGLADLPVHLEAHATLEVDPVHTCTASPATLDAFAAGWRDDHPRTRGGRAVFRAVELELELGLGVAWALHDPYELANALGQAEADLIDAGALPDVV